MSRKWLFGTGCSAELKVVHDADAWSVRRIQFLTGSPIIVTRWASEFP